MKFTKKCKLLWSMKIEDSIWFVKSEERVTWGSSNKGFLSYEWNGMLHIFNISFSNWLIHWVVCYIYTWKFTEHEEETMKKTLWKMRIYKCEWAKKKPVEREAHSWFLMKTKWDFLTKLCYYGTFLLYSFHQSRFHFLFLSYFSCNVNKSYGKFETFTFSASVDRKIRNKT
jgi:hypothetical protein